jgi:alpha-N-arabinofuranosidase
MAGSGSARILTIPNTRGFRNDVVGALRALKVPMVRWPGGCFADEYHWREGIGDPTKRPVKVNTHWGGVTEPNRVGTHEYMDLVEQIGAEAYISGNVGDGTPREMAEWVEYMTAPAGTLADERAANGHKAPWAVPYFGIGNELWGCGGNMRAEFAADETRRYSTFIKLPEGAHTIKVASGANVDDYAWTEAMMKIAGDKVDGLSLHYYTVPGQWPPRASATEFDESGWQETLSEANRIDDLITRHSAIMDKYDPKKRVFLAVDEWGTWFAGEKGTNPGFLHQQNTMRDAGGGDLAQHLCPSCRSRAADRRGADGQCASGDDPDRRPQDGADADLSRLCALPPVAGRHRAADHRQGPDLWRGQVGVPGISASAVKGKDGKVHVALANLDPNHAAPLSVAWRA